MEEIEQRIQDIRDDRTHGSTFLAREAVTTWKQAAELSQDSPQLATSLNDLALELMTARPAMAALKNVTRWFLAECPHIDPATVIHLCNRILERMENSSLRASQHASSLIDLGDIVLTCSYRCAVLRTFHEARGSGRDFGMLAVESGRGNISYSRAVQKELIPHVISVEVVKECGIPQAISRASLVMVEADKLLPDGSLINGVPTLKVAKEAQDRIPLYSVCESYKFDDDKTLEEGFERIRSHLITSIVTEKGVSTPSTNKRSCWCTQ